MTEGDYEGLVVKKSYFLSKVEIKSEIIPQTRFFTLLDP